MKRNIVVRQALNTTQYVNTNTGETLASEHPNITSVNKKIKDLQIVSSDEFIVIDSNALRYVQSYFTKVEYARILDMANMVRGNYNCLYLDGRPCSLSDLSVYFGYTRNIFAKFVSKLQEHSIINVIIGSKNNTPHAQVMLNPTLARKSKTFHTDCLSMFDDLSTVTW